MLRLSKSKHVKIQLIVNNIVRLHTMHNQRFVSPSSILFFFMKSLPGIERPSRDSPSFYRNTRPFSDQPQPGARGKSCGRRDESRSASMNYA